MPIRVEGASFRGRIVAFEIVPPWAGASREPEFTAWGDWIWPVFWFGVPLAAAVLARLNWKTGRADLSGAWRVGLLSAFLSLLFRCMGADDAMRALLFGAVPDVLYVGVVTSVFYLALEPWFRREWPEAMITWSRVLAGRWRDPLVGRDILIGLLLGVVGSLGFRLAEFDLIRRGGPPASEPGIPPSSYYLDYLLGPFSAMTGIVGSLGTGFFIALGLFAGLLLFRTLLRNKWLAAAPLVVLLVMPATMASGNHWTSALISTLTILVFVLGMFRFGLFATIVNNCVLHFVPEAILTTGFTMWYGASSLAAVIVVSGLALVGFRLSLLGRPVSSASRA
jgi:serine/threonine-protein kinase